MCVCPLKSQGSNQIVLILLWFLAGGARDAHWTGANEDASVASVKSIGTPNRRICLERNLRGAQAVYFVVSFSKGLTQR